jgi:hypothetical protein
MAIISALSTFALCGAKNKTIAEKAIFFCPLFDCVDVSRIVDFLSLCCVNLFNGRGSDILLWGQVGATDGLNICVSFCKWWLNILDFMAAAADLRRAPH